MSHYATLGVGRDATSDDIKRAFRRIALQDHPDRNPGDAAAELRFKHAAAAFAVVGDPDNRRAYDNGDDVERRWVPGSPDTLDFALDLFKAAMDGMSVGFFVGGMVNDARARTRKGSCQLCRGRGRTERREGLFTLSRECSLCHGTGGP